MSRKQTRRKIALIKEETALAVARWEEERDSDLFDLEEALWTEPDSLKNGGFRWIEE